MMLFIDFDSTLFYTEQYKQSVGLGGMMYKENPPLYWDALSRHTDLSPFLFSDAFSFLEGHARHRRILLTFGDKEYQKTKISKSGILHLFDDTIFTGNEMKGDIIQRMFPNMDESAFFIDDDVSQLQSMRAMCPQVISVRMKRKNVLYNSDVVQDEFPEVSGLEEFVRLLASYKRN